MEPTHPHNQVENVTAPSAGGFPDPDGEDSRRGAEAQRRRGGGREFRDTLELFSATDLVCWQRITPTPPLKKGLDQGLDPTHPDWQFENVTAPSAGGFPGPDGEVRLRMRLFFRTGSN
ncbi:MAG: hypothetical protein ACOX52_15970 [Verrucomicrobiota bacterium]